MALTIPNTLSNGITVDGLNLEANFDAIAGWAAASVVEVGGATMTGPIVLSGAPTIDNHAATKAYIDTLVAAAVLAANPVGSTKLWPAAAAPTGWALANGAAVSRATYATLYALVGTTWGVGDGVTTFNLPNMCGRTPIGVGTGVGLTARTLAGQVGVEDVTLTAAQSGLPAHTHIQTRTFTPSRSSEPSGPRTAAPMTPRLT